jgi:heme O synthase-like polyprenyltransferase
VSPDLELALRLADAADAISLARRTFRFSITYLASLFAALLIDHYFKVLV